MQIVERARSEDVELVYIGIGVHNGEIHVVNVYECPNVSENPKYLFKADPICMYRVFKTAETMNLSIVLLIHSHPAKPEPSVLDLENMKYWRAPWLIVDSRTGEYKAWLYTSSEVMEIPIEQLDC